MENALNASALTKFLFQPNEPQLELDILLTQMNIEELRELDIYLEKQIKDQWTNDKIEHGIDLKPRRWQQAWPGKICTRLLISDIQKNVNKKTANFKLSENTPNLYPLKTSADIKLSIVTRGGYLDRELSRTFHPSIENSTIECQNLKTHEIGPIAKKIDCALGLLERHSPKSFSVISNSISAVAPLKVTPELEPGKCISLSVSAAPGIAFVTLAPIIMMSETLLHEAAHSRLSAAEQMMPIWKHNSPLLQSPLRPDLRPISGLIHQAYVLFWLTKYYRDLRPRTDIPIIIINERQIEKRLSDLTLGLYDALSTLSSNDSGLTDFGNNLVKTMVQEKSS